MDRFTTRDEAIQHLILDALGEHADEHDVDAIADQVIGDYEDGYRQVVDADTFWQIVADNAR